MIYWDQKLYYNSDIKYNLYINKQYKFNNFYKLWRLGYSGFYADELFARLVEVYFQIICLIPSIFILDKWISKIMGAGGLREILKWINNRVYYQRLDLFILINLFTLGYILLITGISLLNLFIFNVS